MAIRVQSTAFDPGAEVNAMHAANVGVGAVVVLSATCATLMTGWMWPGCSLNTIRA